MTPRLISAPQAAMAARRWIGTPWAHQHAARGLGCDCLGLVRGVYADLTGLDVPIPAYGRDWDEAMLWDGLARYLIRAPEPGLGRVLVFRRGRAPAARHVAIQTAADRMVHCLERRGVREDDIGRNWARLWLAAFDFPAACRDGKKKGGA